MRKCLFTMFFVSFSLFCFAQEHLSFKGIPITGSITTFCQKLKAKGFVQQASQGNIRILEGDFTGRKATVGVIAAENGKDVYSVAVFFEESQSWNTLVNTYEHYKDLYIEKYGLPIQCLEDNPSYSDSNTSLMHELNQGRVTYVSIFEAIGGSIQISIEKGNINDGYVMIKYQDAQNIKAKRQSDLAEI
mgnify:FL=1